MNAVVQLLGSTSLWIAVAITTAAWGWHLVSRRQEPHLRDVVAVVVEPPRFDRTPDHASAMVSVRWVTSVRYEVAGRAWQRTVLLDDRREVGSAVALRYDERSPDRVEPSPRDGAAADSAWRFAWPLTGFSAALVGLAVWGVLNGRG